MTTIHTSIKSTHGYTLAVVAVAPDTARFPVAILLHGYGSGKDNRLNQRLAPWLATHGVGSIRFDFAGHGESGATTRDLTIGSGADDLKTIFDTRAALFDAQVDPKSVVVAASFGGSCLLRVVKSLPDLSAIVLRAPVSNYTETRRRQLGDAGIENWRRRGVVEVSSSKGPLESGYQFYADAAKHDVYSEVQGLKVPTLVIQGSKDDTVLLSESQLLVASIGSQARLLVIDGADHSFGRTDDFEQLFDATTAFIQRHLKR